MGRDSVKCRLVAPYGVMIAVEGIDGAGVTTHSRLLVEKLSLLGLPAVYTKEPTRGPIGKLIRSVLVEELVGLARQDILAFLFMADRLYHLYEEEMMCGRGVLECILNGYIVVLDRYKYSSLAYQTSADRAPLSLEEAQKITSMAPPPHILVYLDVDVQEATARIRARGDQLQLLEKQLSKVKKRFDEIVEMLAREPEYCGEKEQPPWAQRGWPTIVYSKTNCYPSIIVVRGSGRTIESVSAELVSRVLKMLKKHHIIECV